MANYVSIFSFILWVIVLSTGAHCRSLTDSIDGVMQANNRLRYPEPFNRMKRLNPGSDDHTPEEERPEVEGVIENEDGTISDPNNTWQDDDDDQDFTCSNEKIVEEENHRMLCLNLLTNIYDLAKGYDESNDDDENIDLTLPPTTKSTTDRQRRVRRKRRAVLVRDVIISTTELNMSANDGAGGGAGAGARAVSGTTTTTSGSKHETNEEDNEDDEDDMTPYVLVEPGATRTPVKPRSKVSRVFTTTVKSSTKAPFTGSNDESRDDVSMYQLTQPGSKENSSTATELSTLSSTTAATLAASSGSSTGSTTSSSTGKPDEQITNTNSGDQTITTKTTGNVPLMITDKTGGGQTMTNSGSKEVGGWITEWKHTLENALPGFLPDEQFTEKEKMVRNNVCTRLVTLPFVHDRCCVTLSIVCAELMTPEDEVKVKTVNNNVQTSVDTETQNVVDNKEVENGNNNDKENENGTNNNHYNTLKNGFKKLVGDAIQSLASLVADMVKNSK